MGSQLTSAAVGISECYTQNSSSFFMIGYGCKVAEVKTEAMIYFYFYFSMNKSFDRLEINALYPNPCWCFGFDTILCF